MSAPVFRPAREADAPQVAALLNAHMNPRIPPEVFARILTYDWAGEKPHAGVVAEAEGEVVGYHGAVWSTRFADGRAHLHGNFSSLYVHRDWRGHDLGQRMMRTYTDRPDVTYTVFNPSRRVHGILEACGFVDLDTHRRVWEADAPDGGAEAVTDPAAIEAEAPAEARRILADHAGLPMVPALLRAGGRQAFCAFLRQDRGERGLCWDLIHVDDPAAAAEAIPRAARRLLGGDPRARLLADERFFDGRDPGGTREALAYRRMFRPAAAPPPRWRVDHLYSETLLLGLKIA